MVVSACGGGDGSASSAAGAQGTEPSSEFRSFVAVNPQVKAAIAAKPVAIKAENELADEAADRASEDDATSQDSDDSASTSTSSSSSSDSSSDDSSSESSSDDSSSDSEASEDSSASTGNGADFVDTLISDMSEMNDLVLKDVNTKYGFSRGPGYVISGINSGGSNFLLPWFVQFEGEGNAARHTRVQMRNMSVFIKSRSSGEWERLLHSESYDGIQCDQGSNYFHCPQMARVQDEDSGGVSSLPLTNLNLHGWWGSRAPIDSGDLGAIVVTLQARLIPDGDVDDRAQAKYLLHVGADYYPEDASPSEVLPPVGISRSKLVTNEWQTFGMTTLNDVGLQEPGGGISSDELRADPPPLN
jgi:hypothetical protein